MCRRVGYRATAYASTPDLVYVSPGVQVIADYPEPVFYSGNVYYRYYNGYWYQSPNYRTNWQLTYNVPTAVRRIDRPYAYVKFRGHGRVNRAARPVPVRDHRRR